MCLAIPGKVIEIDGHKVVIQYPSEQRQALLGDDLVKVGDFVLVQMGIVLKVLSEKEAKIAFKAWK